MIKVEKRYAANVEILWQLELLVHKYPHLRFHQLLDMIGMTEIKNPDKFYEESVDTLNKLKKYLNDYDNQREAERNTDRSGGSSGT